MLVTRSRTYQQVAPGNALVPHVFFYAILGVAGATRLPIRIIIDSALGSLVSMMGEPLIANGLHTFQFRLTVLVVSLEVSVF